MKWASLVAVLVAGLLAWAYWVGWGESAVTQPIQFPHNTHVEVLKLECMNCHQRAERDAPAGRPLTALCMACHLGAEKTRETEKILAYGEKGQEIPWRRVWRLPSHVFFPHQTHVAVAKIGCQTCHGPMETLDRPPARPLRVLTMDDCIGCHEKWEWPKEAEPARVATARRLTTDCNACHR